MTPLLVRAAPPQPVARTPGWFLSPGGRALPWDPEIRQRHPLLEGRPRPEPGLVPLDAPVLFCLFLSVPAEHWGELDEWFEREHAPILLSDPDWLMTRRLETISCDPERYSHIILHYLADERALASETMARARATDWYRKLAGQHWFRPHSVIYHRRGDRFVKAAFAQTLTQGERQ